MTKKHPKWYVSSALALAALAVLAVMVLAGITGREKQHRYFAIHQEDGRYILFADGKQIQSGEGKVTIVHSLDLSRAMITVRPQGDVYMAQGETLRLMAQGAKAARPSVSGQGILYQTGEGVFLYRNGKTVSIGPIDGHLRDCVISPDGGTVGYIRDGAGWCYSGGRVHKIGQNIQWYGVADGGKYLYFADWDARKSYVQRGWNEGRRMELPGAPGAFNRDLSEAVLWHLPGEDHCWDGHLLVKGKKLIPLGETGQVWFFTGPEEELWEGTVKLGGQTTVVADLRSFQGHFYTTVDTRFSSAYQPKYAARLYLLDGEPRLLQKGLREGAVCVSGKTAYYVDDLLELYRLDLQGEPEKLEEFVEEIWAVNFGDGAYCQDINQGSSFYIDGEQGKAALAFDRIQAVFSGGEGQTALLSCSRTEDGTAYRELWADRQGDSRMLLKEEKDTGWKWSWMDGGLWLYDTQAEKAFFVGTSEFDSLWETGFPEKGADQ